MSRRQAPSLAGSRPVGGPAGNTARLSDRQDQPPLGGDADETRSAALTQLALVAAYARVSSDKQEKEQSIDSQVDALREVAGERHWPLATDMICIDDGY